MFDDADTRHNGLNMKVSCDKKAEYTGLQMIVVSGDGWNRIGQ